VNVWIQGFDDVKVESNKVASTNIQRLNITLRLIQCQEKDKVSNNLTGWLVFASKQIISKRSKALAS